MSRKILQTSVAAAALFAFTATYSAPASAADDTFKTGTKASLTMSGQVNRAVQFVDDGTNSNINHVDNDNSSTRIRWVGKGQVTDVFSMGMLWETQFESNSSSATFLGPDSDDKSGKEKDQGPAGFGERKMEVWLNHKSLGKLTLGQGDTASNGSAEVNFLGQGAQYAGVADLAGGNFFRASAALDSAQPASTTCSGGCPTIGNLWDQHDGLSRNDRIRYDTPKIAGFVASGSHIQGDNWDIGARYSGKFGQFKTKAALFYASIDGTSSTTDDQIAGSIAVLHDSGLNLTFSAGTRERRGLDRVSESSDVSRDDDSHYYVAIGYIAKLIGAGTTRFAVDYGQADDVLSNNSEISTFGIGVTQNLKAISSDIYAVFRNHDADFTVGGVDVPVDDINVFMAGARVKF